MEEIKKLLKLNNLKINSEEVSKILSSSEKRKKQRAKFSFIDLFCGIGGIRIPFDELGGKCVFSSEIDKYAKLTYFCNFKEMPSGDISQIPSYKVPDHDILLAGFPCQPFSYAGYKKGLEDQRGDLFFEILRLLKAKKPKAFLLENVKGLLSIEKGKVFDFMLNKLNQAGYKLHYKVMDSMEYGNLPQTRKRVYIVGFRDKKINFNFPTKTPLKKKIGDLLMKSKQDGSFYYERFDIHKTLKKEMTKKNTIYQWRRVYVRENKSNACPTLTANTGTGGHNVPLILTRYGIRKLTPLECLRFQGFPLSFILPHFVSKTQLYKQIGNSVSVPVVRKIASKMIGALEDKSSYKTKKSFRENETF